MPKFFTKRKERCNLRSRSKNQSCTPKSKVDACVECDLPFDESKVAPELRRGPVTKEGTSSDLLEPSHKNSVGFDKTSLVPVDISVVSDSDDSLSALASAASEPSQNLKKNFIRKKKKKKRTVRITFLQQVVNGYPRVRHLLLVIFHLLVSTLPSTTAPADPTIIEQPEVINNTPIVINYIACGGQQLPTINSPADIYKHFSR